jgi:hypothetical protein
LDAAPNIGAVPALSKALVRKEFLKIQQQLCTSRLQQISVAKAVGVQPAAPKYQKS